MSGNKGLNDIPAAQMSTRGFDDDDDESNEDDDSFVDDEFNEEKVRKALIKFVCLDQCSPRIVESPGFKHFMSTANPLIQLGDLKSLKADILKFYEEERMKIKQILRNWDGKLSLSLEIFRSQWDDYTCLKLHFISNTWKCKEWVLGFKKVCDDEGQLGILKSIRYFGIEDKIFTVTFNNYFNGPELLEMVKSDIQNKKQLELNGQLFHVYCCGDLFTSMAQDAFDEISEIINKLWDIHPPVKSEYWPSFNSSLKHALMEQLTSDRVLSAEECQKTEQISNLVDKLYGVAKLLFEARNPTGSTFFINLHDLRVSLRKDASSSCSSINAIAEKMLQKLDKYWKDMFLVMAIASVLDPRCKMVYIEYLSNQMEVCDDNLRHSTVLQSFLSLYENYATSVLKQENSDSDSNASENEFPTYQLEGVGSPNNIVSHLQDYKDFVQATSQPPMSDLDWYLAEPVHPWDQDFNLLNWWRTASPKYPILSKMARDILSIHFTVRTSLNAYYMHELRPVDQRLLSSGPLLMNAIMCTGSWLQKQ